MKVTCRGCGKKFERANPKQLYCTHRCAAKYRARRFYAKRRKMAKRAAQAEPAKAARARA